MKKPSLGLLIAFLTLASLAPTHQTIAREGASGGKNGQKNLARQSPGPEVRGPLSGDRTSPSGHRARIKTGSPGTGALAAHVGRETARQKNAIVPENMI